jgi:hypothetical protein
MSDLSEVLTLILTTICCKITERLSLSKQATQKIDMQRFDVKKLNNAEAKGILSGQNQKQVCNFGKYGRKCGHHVWFHQNSFI